MWPMQYTIKSDKISGVKLSVFLIMGIPVCICHLWSWTLGSIKGSSVSIYKTVLEVIVDEATKWRSRWLAHVFQVQDTSFILCVVVIQPEIPVKQLKNLNTVPSSKLLYHRLDLLGQPNACLHFKQLATLGRALMHASVECGSRKSDCGHKMLAVSSSWGMFFSRADSLISHTHWSVLSIDQS